jgi:hypothetical protein
MSPLPLVRIIQLFGLVGKITVLTNLVYKKLVLNLHVYCWLLCERCMVFILKFIFVWSGMGFGLHVIHLRFSHYST